METRKLVPLLLFMMRWKTYTKTEIKLLTSFKHKKPSSHSQTRWGSTPIPEKNPDSRKACDVIKSRNHGLAQMKKEPVNIVSFSSAELKYMRFVIPAQRGLQFLLYYNRAVKQ